MKKLFIKTYGCQMNVYDSVKMKELLSPHGFLETNEISEADMVILNTCHIREKASEKVYSELGRIKKYKDKRAEANQDMIIAVAGCTAQAEGEEVFKRAPFIDIVVGPQSYHNLPELIEKVKRDKKWVIELNFNENEKFDKISNLSSQGASAFLAVQEGCDKFCHFCVVPYTRGAEFSRPIRDIYREAQKLVMLGSKEITLLGQNVSGYNGNDSNGDSKNLSTLIKELSCIEGLERIRYITSHPADMNDDSLFELHATEKKLMPYLHLPIQSGSNKILKTMNRRHTAEFYLDIIAKFRNARNDIALSSDFIVGYPGETEQDFLDTLEIIKEVKYAQCYSFKYSQRPGTPASTMPNQVPEEVKIERLERLQKLTSELQLEFNNKSVGKIVPVLFEKSGKKDGQISGKSPYLQSVIVNSTNQEFGDILNIKVTRAAQNCLYGKL